MILRTFFTQNLFFLKKHLIFSSFSAKMVVAIIFIEKFKEVQSWQNAITAESRLPSELRFPTHTEDQTEPGNRMFKELRLL